jgi:hypothetical protein
MGRWGGFTLASSELALALGRDASDSIEPEISSTKIQCAGPRTGLSFAERETHRSLPEAKHSRVTSVHRGKSEEKRLPME